MNEVSSLSTLRQESKKSVSGAFAASLRIPACITALCLVLAGIDWWTDQQALAIKQQTAINEAADRLKDALTARLLGYEAALRGVKGLYESSGDVDQKKYRTYFEALEISRSHPGLQGVAIALRVPLNQRVIHQQHQRNNSNSKDYSIKPSGMRAEYFPIVAIEPFDDGNKKALGFDIGTNPIAMVALRRSLETGGMVLTGKLKLAQDADSADARNTSSIVMYVPILDRESDTVKGWVSGPFRLQDLLTRLDGLSDDELALTIFDGANSAGDGNLLWGGPNTGQGLKVERLLGIGGQQWQLQLQAKEKFIERWSDQGSQRNISLASAVISLLLGYVSWLLISGRERATAVAQVMTAELRSSEGAMRKNNAQLKLLEISVAKLNDIVLITEAEPFDSPGPRIVFVNDAFERRTGYAREEVLGKSPRILQGEKTQRAELNRIRVALEKWEPVRAELINYTKSGQEFWLELEIVPIADDSGWYTHWVAIERDITERKKTQEALQSSLSEKVALLNEVHHRVKNNLQVVTSLLRLERSRCQHEETKAVLEDMQSRIRSMALLHETIYRHETFSSIDLGRYIAQVATQTFRAMQANLPYVKLRLNLASVSVGLDQATPCGLLVSELVSNSLKYAFTNGREGEVCISLQPGVKPDSWCLRISDTGAGLPAGAAALENKTLGLKLAGTLAAQIGGKLDIGPGALFTVVFTAAAPAPLALSVNRLTQAP